MDNLGKLLINIRDTFPDDIDCQNKEFVTVMFEENLPEYTIDLSKFLKNVKPGSTIHFFSRSYTNKEINIINFYYKGEPNNFIHHPRDYWIAKPTFRRYSHIIFCCDSSNNYEFYLQSYQDYEIVQGGYLIGIPSKS